MTKKLGKRGRFETGSMDIGLFGGTFNPFHNGHIDIITHVKQACHLDRIYVIPSATPPHKPVKNLASANDRFLMAQKSLEPYDHFQVSDRELVRKGVSYTIDTIREFKALHPGNTRFYLMMGSDAFFDITTWKQQEKIFDTVPLIIMRRGQLKNHEKILGFIDEHISEEYRFHQADNSFSHPRKHKITICNVPRINISSTMIRERIRNNEPVTGLVPECVEQIIQTRGLYQ